MNREEFIQQQQKRDQERLARFRAQQQLREQQQQLTKAPSEISPNQQRLFEKMGMRIKVNKPYSTDTTTEKK